MVSDVDGDWSPVDEEKPTLYLGYIVDAHYQSLLPQAENHPTPAYLKREAIDNTLAVVMQGLDAKLKQQSSQVSFNSKHNLFGPCHHLHTFKVASSNSQELILKELFTSFFIKARAADPPADSATSTMEPGSSEARKSP